MSQAISLSVLIPVYNWDCSDLIAALYRQGQSLGIPFEIIVADDCSTDRSHIEKMRILTAGLENCIFLELSRNLGRAGVRNLMASQSRYSRLLFMDSDSKVVSDTFLREYVDASDSASVICGRVVHPDSLPGPGVELRYRYERKADADRWAEIRQRHPYDQFTPFSFLIDREVFEQIRFDTSYSGYGYEDVAFGMELKRRQVSVLHIDTPLMHMGLEKNSVFLEKSRKAVLNAWTHRDSIGDGSALLNAYYKVKELHITWALRLLWRYTGRIMEKNLLGSNPHLRTFSLYKLCYLCSLVEK